MLMRLAQPALKRLRPHKSERLYVILDESHTCKRAKKMAGLGYFRDPSTGRYLWGHEFLTLGFWFRGLFLPVVLSMYWPKKNVPRGRRFRTVDELTAEMIENLQAPAGLRVAVLFDAFFLNQTVLRAVRRRNWSWVSVVGANRDVFLGCGSPAGGHGRKSKIRVYRRTCWREGFWPIIIGASGRREQNWGAPARNVRLSKVGAVRVVFCRAGSHQTPLALVSPTGAARQLVEQYAQRWSVELFLKESKQLLGIGHYQTRPPAGVERHLQLVSCAHFPLTHVRLLQTARARAKANRSRLARQSLSSAQARLRYLLLCDIQQIAARKARSPRALERSIGLLKAA